MFSYYLLILITLYGLSFFLGLAVTYKNFSVNYARKMFSIGFFLISAWLLTRPETAQGWVETLLSLIVPLLWLLSYLNVFRKKSRFLQICFSTIDRPEDRPFTILWLTTSLIVGYWILILMIKWLALYDAQSLIYITVFISTFGDGLAEPIGVTFGKHTYKARALFTRKMYTRSIEGSTCVALSAISIILAMNAYLTLPQMIAMFALMPIAMTLTEAKSPHTWDNPFMHLVGGLITVLCVQI